LPTHHPKILRARPSALVLADILAAIAGDRNQLISDETALNRLRDLVPEYTSEQAEASPVAAST